MRMPGPNESRGVSVAVLVLVVGGLLGLPDASASTRAGQVGVADPARAIVAPPVKGRTLRVQVGALPSGRRTVEVRGPGGFHKTLRKSTTLRRLTPGRYRITAATVTTTRWVAKPKVSKRKVRVTNKRGALVQVSYPVAVSTDLEVVKPDEVTSFTAPLDGTGKLVTTEDLSRGDIVASGVGPSTPEGMLVRVTVVVSTGRKSTYRVTQARIDEALPRGSFDTTMTADLAPPVGPRRLLRGRAASRGALGCTASGGDPSVSPDGGMAMRMSGTWGAGAPSVSVTLTPYAQTKVKAFIGAQVACKKEISIFDRKFTPITVMIGPVPFVVVPRLRMLAGADLNVNAGLSVDASARLDATLAATASGSGFKTQVTGPTVTRSATVEMQGSASADLYARARFTGDIYGVGGPYGQVRVGVKGQADIASNPWWNLEAYARAGIGVELEKCTQVFVAKLCLSLSAGKDDLINASYAITNAGGPFETPPTPTPTPTLAPRQGAWTNLTAGSRHSCGVQTDDSAWCWGMNGTGQLGDGTTFDREAPAQVRGTWSSLTAGHGHTCGVKTDGSAWCWGSNNYGQVGDGTTTTYRSTPTQVPGDWSSLTAGFMHTCGVKTDGSAWCWGMNGTGQLGDGSTTDYQSTPTQVPGSWSSLAAGESSCGVKTDGSGWCWGLPDPTTPTQVPGSWSSLDPGDAHRCGVKTDGTAWCWGDNNEGQLGDGSTTYRWTPTQVPGSWSTLNAGYRYSCGVKTDGSAWCWGSNDFGQLGDGTTYDRWTPTQVPGTWSSLSPSLNDHSCGVTTDGTGLCWGHNDEGQLGDGTTTDRLNPTLVSGS